MEIKPKSAEEIIEGLCPTLPENWCGTPDMGKHVEERRQEIRQALQSLLYWVAEQMPEKETEPFDNMICSNCKSFVRERIWHTSQDGFSECCGKKLERQQGETEIYGEKNDTIDDCKAAILHEAEKIK